MRIPRVVIVVALFAILLLGHLARHTAVAATFSGAKTVLTGSWPTAAPSSLTANATAVASKNVHALIVVSAATGTVTLACYVVGGVSRWVPIGDVSLDSSVTGGVAYGRFTVGFSHISHCLLWEKTAGATYTTAHIISDISM